MDADGNNPKMITKTLYSKFWALLVINAREGAGVQVQTVLTLEECDVRKQLPQRKRRRSHTRLRIKTNDHTKHRTAKGVPGSSIVRIL